jgi:hypothetical protein
VDVDGAAGAPDALPVVGRRPNVVDEPPEPVMHAAVLPAAPRAQRVPGRASPTPPAAAAPQREPARPAIVSERSVSEQIVHSRTPAVPARPDAQARTAGSARQSIEVHIGRIEVRATLPPPAAPRTTTVNPNRTLALKEYLGRRERQRR